MSISVFVALTLLFSVNVEAQLASWPPRPLLHPLRLCTTTQLEQDKCLYALEVAAKSAIDLRLDCVQTASFQNCSFAVQHGVADLVVADEHQYLKARSADLVPLMYAHERLESFYIAVAPKDITALEFTKAQLDVDLTNDRAYHAAALLNLRRGYGVCGSSDRAHGTTVIKIRDSAVYTPDESELLICADGSLLRVEDDKVDGHYDYSKCNYEVGLERGIFALRAHETNRSFTRLLQNIVDTLGRNFGPESRVWNFFGDFQGVSDVIFKNNMDGFSLIPPNRNGVTEWMFYSLHCDQIAQDHKPSYIE